MCILSQQHICGNSETAPGWKILLLGKKKKCCQKLESFHGLVHCLCLHSQHFKLPFLIACSNSLLVGIIKKYHMTQSSLLGHCIGTCHSALKGTISLPTFIYLSIYLSRRLIQFLCVCVCLFVCVYVKENGERGSQWQMVSGHSPRGLYTTDAAAK